MQEVEPQKGGRKDKYFSLNKSGYFRANKNFIQEHNLEKMKFANIKAIKQSNKLIVAINFLEEKKDNSFSLAYHERSESFSFSGRSIFAQFEISFRDIVREKSLKLKPDIQEFEEEKYFIVEIPI